MEEPSTSLNMNYMGTLQPGNPGTAKVWHQCFPESKRNHMAQKIVQAISSSTDNSTPPEEQVINFVNYARKVERNVYETAHSKGEYYQVLASKIFIIKKALDKRRGVDCSVGARLDSSSDAAMNSSSDVAMDSSSDAAMDNSSDAAMDNSSSSSDAAISELPVNDAISRTNIPRNPSEFNCQSSQSEQPSSTKYEINYERVGRRNDGLRLKVPLPISFDQIQLLKEMLKHPRKKQILHSLCKRSGMKVYNPAIWRILENLEQMQVPQPARQSQPQPARQSQPQPARQSQPQPAQRSQPQAQVKRSNQSGKAISCVVCLDDLLEVQSLGGKQPVSTICGHLFCAGCIRTVIRKWHCCPVCRKDLKKNDYHPIYINQAVKAISCAVCLDDSLEGQSLDSKQPVSTLCGHLFCTGCIRTVIRKWHCCPVCRTHLKKKYYHPIYM